MKKEMFKNSPDVFVARYVRMLRKRGVPFRGLFTRNRRRKTVMYHLFTDDFYIVFSLQKGRNMVVVSKYKLDKAQNNNAAAKASYNVFNKEELIRFLPVMSGIYFELREFRFASPFNKRI